MNFTACTYGGRRVPARWLDWGRQPPEDAGRALHHPSPSEEATALEAVLSTHTSISRLARPALAAALAATLAAGALDARPALAAPAEQGGNAASATVDVIVRSVNERLEEVEAYAERLAQEQAEQEAHDAFVSEWTERIDAYLEGSPLAGYGETFAEAAWAYDVDPRWSPAISCIESSKGAVCFRSHNAWGWGSASWGSWEEAIWAHVQGLAEGYGSTNSLDAAARYCPPSYESWYASVQSEMDRI